MSDESTQRDDLPMPGSRDDAAPKEAQSIEPPPGEGRQVIQLVLIPAMITIVCIGIAVLFSALAGRQDSIDDQLMRLRQSSGGGKIGMGIHDPRYQERCRAAANIATRLPGIADETERQRISDELVDILRNTVSSEEHELQTYILVAVGQLGRAQGIAVIREKLQSDRAQIVQGAVGALGAVPDRDAARGAYPELLPLLAHGDADVRAMASATVAAFVEPSDEEAIAALRGAMQITGSEFLDAYLNAAVGLARVGDRRGSAVVAMRLLDREAATELLRDQFGTDVPPQLLRARADQLMLRTLASAPNMTDEAIWDKIAVIADSDPSMEIRSAARQLLEGRKSSQPKE